MESAMGISFLSWKNPATRVSSMPCFFSEESCPFFHPAVDDDNAGSAGAQITRCGNRQAGKAAFDEQMRILQDHRIPVLSGTCETIAANNQSINLCGVDDPEISPSENKSIFLNQLKNVAAQRDNRFTILLSHRPEYFDLYASYGFDLVLCGHAHGGQWRIPGILNGLYAPNQGIFPRYAGGIYSVNSTTMAVSRGLARESTRIPRIFNRPELVIIDILP